MSPPDILFQAVVVPHRSLSRRGLRLLLAALAVICLGNLTLFATLRAWPVCGFCGGELLLAALLIRLNVHAARASELLLLTPDALRIVRTDPKGRREERTLSPAWLNVDLEERPGRVPALWLATRGVREEVARALGEGEKRDLARALADALYRLRHPTFDNLQLAD